MNIVNGGKEFRERTEKLVKIESEDNFLQNTRSDEK